ncbi:MAG: tRNA (adenosine(37)-N6)-threonylcarbamoyltransferase complex ATPase subunit type 1 TsaE [Firmicutes bacterium]|nr:tRNA (adenosine(37)-N6)-threonylcarbamoyltransferase complex ATPase subunit type 1 TsaE [Bacillota bacterium]
MVKIISNSEGDTFAIGAKIGKSLKVGDVVICNGQLGSGKTALTKGIASAFNIKNVHSPTFTLLNEYEGDVKLYHFDAYRISESDWMDCGFDEYLYGDGICVIEWGENIKGILPDNIIDVSISPNTQCGDNSRLFLIKGAKL